MLRYLMFIICSSEGAYLLLRRVLALLMASWVIVEPESMRAISLMRWSSLSCTICVVVSCSSSCLKTLKWALPLPATCGRWVMVMT